MRKGKCVTAVGLVITASLFFATPYVMGWVPQCAIDGSCRVLQGRMTGGGSIFMGTQADGDFFVEPGTRLTHGFELHCDITEGPNNLQVEIHRPDGQGGTFHMDHLTAAYCYNSPTINAGKPTAPFNSLFGQGTGRYNGTPGYCADWEFTDAGEPGTDDQIQSMRIWQPANPGDCSTNAAGPIVFASTAGHTLTYGNHQAHKDSKSPK
jgi:hypothetical protein